MTTTEPEWDDDERAYMIALGWWEASRCPLCGGPRDECQGEGADRRFQGLPPTRCYRTDAIASYQDAQADYPRPQALLWGAEMRD